MKSSSPPFTFIDLFAGIGGMRMGFEAHGGQCVFSSEKDKFARETYTANFPDTPFHDFAGDITQVAEADVPDHDVLLAGFPCQPFSIAGVSKKNSMGRSHGFTCETQGTLFFDIARIIAEKRPKAFLLENVKNLLHHDKGNTFGMILKTLEQELGYEFHWKLLSSDGFVPQKRERVFMVGFDKYTDFSWDDLNLPPKGAVTLSSVLEDNVDGKYTISTKRWRCLRDHKERHRKKGNGFGYSVVDGDVVTRTLPANYYKDGGPILLSQGGGNNPRKLTPRECARLMGFPDTFKIPVSDTQAYRQFGNSVVVPLVGEIARVMVGHI